MMFHQTEREGVAAVERALSLLVAFGEGEDALTLATLAARTGLYKSTILRLLASLERFRCVERRPDGRWALGPMLFVWGSRYRRSLALEALLPPALAELAARTGETASFWRREGEHRLCLMRVGSRSPIRDDIHPGALLPLPHGAGGRVLVEFCQFGAATAGPRLRSTFGERNPETAGIAAPVFGADGALLGALAISGPKARLYDARLALEPVVEEAAAALTRRLGGDLAQLQETKP
jgi:DNA-binding IclR family transcriptional regulator